MKKKILIIFAILTIFLVYNKVYANEFIIPDTAIRLRVIPNSNSNYDQAMKSVVKNYMEENFYTLFENVNNIEEARKVINNNIDNLNIEVQNIFDKYNYNMNFNIKYGNNYFPSKEYRNVKYEEGYYESLVVSIGKAEGDNFWCVLFPNLCIVNEDEAKYSSLVKEIFDKLFNNKKIK